MSKYKIDASKGKKSAALLALSSAAMLLPALSNNALADAPPENIELAYRYSNYQEEATDAAKTFGPNSSGLSSSVDRYNIEINQFRLLLPVGDKYSLAVDLQTEALSGASPWFTGSADGKTKLVMSGASIKEDREDIAANFRFYASEGNAGISLSRSNENDYVSNAFSLDGSYNINEKHTTLSAGLSFSDDTIEPTQGLIPVEIIKESKNSTSLFVGVGQVINKNAILQAGLSYTRLSGYLTDPYKYRDQRPGDRQQWAWSLGYRQYISSADAALQADYRFYNDDWGINSHTLSLAWYQNVKEYLKIIPYARYYTQQEADFFSNNARLNDAYFADDFRLSTYGAFTTGLRVEADYKSWTFIVSGEFYDSDSRYGISNSNEESPGLVSYGRYTFGVNYTFK
ncbi:MAG: DUF3570 domain-containing protein [Pseudomonadales bacterium]|nr:DUF3570 domain-containing protein [Pseudomonadales bacterium]